VHRRGVDLKDHGFAAAGADALSGPDVGGQVHVVPVHRPQSVAHDLRQEARDRAVVEDRGRLDGRQAQSHRDAVALVRTDAPAVRTEREALLVVARDHFQQVGAGHAQGGEQVFDLHPPGGVEPQPDLLGSVPQMTRHPFGQAHQLLVPHAIRSRLPARA
jgi:hypothetical protein